MAVLGEGGRKEPMPPLEYSGQLLELLRYQELSKVNKARGAGSEAHGSSWRGSCCLD